MFFYELGSLSILAPNKSQITFVACFFVIGMLQVTILDSNFISLLCTCYLAVALKL